MVSQKILKRLINNLDNGLIELEEISFKDEGQTSAYVSSTITSLEEKWALVKKNLSDDNEINKIVSVVNVLLTERRLLSDEGEDVDGKFHFVYATIITIRDELSKINKIFLAN